MPNMSTRFIFTIIIILLFSTSASAGCFFFPLSPILIACTADTEGEGPSLSCRQPYLAWYSVTGACHSYLFSGQCDVEWGSNENKSVKNFGYQVSAGWDPGGEAKEYIDFGSWGNVVTESLCQTDPWLTTISCNAQNISASPKAHPFIQQYANTPPYPKTKDVITLARKNALLAEAKPSNAPFTTPGKPAIIEPTNFQKILASESGYYLNILVGHQGGWGLIWEFQWQPNPTTIPKKMYTKPIISSAQYQQCGLVITTARTLIVPGIWMFRVAVNYPDPKWSDWRIINVSK